MLCLSRSRAASSKSQTSDRRVAGFSTRHRGWKRNVSTVNKHLQHSRVLRHITHLATFSLLAAGCPSEAADEGEAGGSTSSSTQGASSTGATNPGGDSSGSNGSTAGTQTSGAGTESSDESSEGTVASSTGDDTSSGGDESSTGTTVEEPFCGDGTVDPDEACDDGNANDNDTCTSTCEPQWASGNDGDCSAALALHCDYHGAQCRLNEGGSDSYCYWPEAAAQEGCDETPGIWTLADSGFAMDHPEMTFPEEGACLTQAANLRCEAGTAATCTGAAADLCTASRPSSGLGTSGPDICYWAGDAAACEATSGTWTTPADGFAMDHPNALPAGMAGCITQVTNL